MFSRSILHSLIAALLISSAAALALDYDTIKLDPVTGEIPNIRQLARQLQGPGVNSTCLSYGIDFQDDKSYFINSQLDVPFTAVTQFTGCNNDFAYVVLVDDETEDQYQCSNIGTLPDDASHISYCPINKNQMTSGEWTLIVIGNNGNGHPFAYQRDFYLTVGVPETITSTPTVTYTYTTYPNTTLTSTSIVYTTTTIHNNLTITVPGQTLYSTFTPTPTSVTTTKTTTRTVTKWTKTLSTITTIVQPSCTIPSRPWDHDPHCYIVPTVVPIPSGLTITSNTSTTAPLRRRAPDPATITINATAPVNSTTTSYAPTTTLTNVVLANSTIYTTEPPQTVVTGVTTIGTTLPQSTKTITSRAYTKVFTTETYSLTWTYTTRASPSAEASQECKAEGGHFGHWEM